MGEYKRVLSVAAEMQRLLTEAILLLRSLTMAEIEFRTAPLGLGRAS